MDRNKLDNRLVHSDNDEKRPPGSRTLRPVSIIGAIIGDTKEALLSSKKALVCCYNAFIRQERAKIVEKNLKKLDDPFSEITADKQLRLVYESYSTMDKMLPKFLYKYREGKDKDIQNLINDVIYLTEPRNFNDPKECKSYVDIQKFVKYAFTRKEHVAEAYSRLLCGEDLNDEDNQWLNKAAVFGEYGLEQIIHIKNMVKIACLSESIDSTLMWAHYSCNHKGFAIRYRMDDQDWCQCNNCKERDGVLCRRPEKPLYPVIYRGKRYNATKYAMVRAAMIDANDGIDPEDYPMPLLPILQKDRCWKYEHEWRIICYNRDIKNMPLKAEAIFLGAEVSNELAEKLWIIAKNKGLKVYKMYVDDFSNSFDLKYDDITDYSEGEFQRLILQD